VTDELSIAACFALFRKFLARLLKRPLKTSPVSVYNFGDILNLKSGKDIVFAYFWQLVLQEGSPLFASFNI
jgi:hypothetical protein